MGGHLNDISQKVLISDAKAPKYRCRIKSASCKRSDVLIHGALLTLKPQIHGLLNQNSCKSYRLLTHKTWPIQQTISESSKSPQRVPARKWEESPYSRMLCRQSGLWSFVHQPRRVQRASRAIPAKLSFTGVVRAQTNQVWGCITMGLQVYRYYLL